ncbi:MAG: 16S rRNA (uracil(1498)-N(3))-methyltransferase [Desulfobacteraceae bacterium 4572_35.1]|nr:MAG: 16S rRNA (uracil(1498)-N(3))-methyltransferase [Desulfobacteraceae bacterium 4572_35.1]
MNLIVLYPEDYTEDGCVCISDYRHRYVRDIHRPQLGARLKVGDVNGMTGSGEVVHISDSSLTLKVRCTERPPQPLELTLIIALPRPKVLQRVLLTATTLGIKRIYICNSWRVDKSYWGSPVLTEQGISRQLITGLEQAGDTLVPQVILRPRFKPFVEDELPAIVHNNNAYVAHPGTSPVCPYNLGEIAVNDDKRQTLIAVGPEGGFIPYEFEKLVGVGFTPVTLGRRILRVETALTWLAARM